MDNKEKIYTEEYVENELKELLEEVRQKPDMIYFGELFLDKRYSRQRYSEWLQQYGHNAEIKSTSDTIKEIFETRVVKGALNNKFNSTVTIFHLKNNYNWKDKHEVESNQNIRIDNIKNLPTEDLLKYLNS